MLLSFNWLKDYTDIKDTPHTLAQHLTMAGIGISSIDKANDDFVYDAEITPNRPDLLSMIGIAREVACITKSKFTPPQEAENFDIKDKNTGIAVEVKAPSACLRYNATLIRDVKVKVSKQKITRRLSTLGIRAVNNIVDITNYCLLDSGQPLHAFDYDKIKAGKIIIRWARQNESILAIDGKEYKLDEDILVIADEEKPIAIAGIMGGIDSEINLETKNILLECAHFDPIVIRKASRKLGLKSDSSYRFERGICLDEIPPVARRTAYLIKDCASANITANVDIINTQLRDRYATLRTKELERILGFSIPLEDIKKILNTLGFELTSIKSDALTLKIPTFRQDIFREVDLIEEVARIYGYDKIPTTLAKISPKEIQKYQSVAKVAESFKYKATSYVRNILTSCGLNEVITHSLMNKKDLNNLENKDQQIIKVKNPLSVEQEVLRPTLITGLLNVLNWNLNRQLENVMIFELGKVFYKENSLLCEKEKLGICLCGNKFLGDWQIKPKPLNFFDLKGIIENLLKLLGISDYNFVDINSSFFTNGQSSKVVIGTKDIVVLGKVKKQVLNIFDIAEDVYAAEVYFEQILPCIKLESKIKPIPKFPAIIRDLAIIVKDDLPSRLIVQEIKRAAKTLMKEIILFDVYSGKQIPPGFKSLAYSIKYQSGSRTLTDEEVDKIQTEIQKALVENLKAQIR